MSAFMEMLKRSIDQPCGAMAPPFTRWLNGVIRDIGSDHAAIEYLVRKELTNPGGNLHGGVQSAMLDDAFGMLCNALGRPNFMVSVNFCIDYLETAREGDVILARVHVVREGNRMVNVQGTLRGSDERLIAQASSNLMDSKVPNPMAG